MKLLGKLVCAMTRKHKRGKMVGAQSGSVTGPVNVYKCPRCDATWTRKVKANAAQN